MRPRDRNDEESSPPASPSPKPKRAALSSMVVVAEPSASAHKSVDGDEGSLPHASPPLRRRSLSPPVRRRSFSPPPRRRISPLRSPRRRRRSPSGSFQPRYDGYRENRGYGMREGSLSPPRRRRVEDASFNERLSPRYGFHGSRGVDRVQDMSPPNGKGNRAYGTGPADYGRTEKYLTPDDHYLLRNDPNLSPREGDWICQNPNCGNLNFARRNNCNSCNKYRFAPDNHGPSRSPRAGGYMYSPARISPGRSLGTSSDHRIYSVRVRYRSPHDEWILADPRELPTRSPTGRPGRYPELAQRGRERGKLEWHAPADFNHREHPRDVLFIGRRGRRSPSPPAHFARDIRDRRRSPVADRPLRSSFDSRGRDERNRDDAYSGRGRGRGREVVDRGHSYRDRDDSFPARGRGGRHAASRGRKNAVY